MNNAVGGDGVPPAAAYAPDEVWCFDESAGFSGSIESAGTIAAPLLAGFAFTLLVLVLPSIGDTQTATQLAEQTGAVAGTHPFSRFPELAVGLLLLAGLLMIMSVQAAIHARRHVHGPGDIEELYPQYFRDAPGFDPAKEPAWTQWTTPEWPAVELDGRWYGGWARRFFYEERKAAVWWYVRTRWLYHLGILSLLAGITILLVPPSSSADGWRWLIVAIAAAGALAEAAWMVPTSPFTELALKVRRTSHAGNANRAETNPPASS